MKLRAKLSVSFLLVALVIAAVGSLVFLNSKSIADSFNMIDKGYVPQIIALQQMRTDSITVYSRALEYTVEENQTELRDYLSEIAGAEQDFNSTYQSFETTSSIQDPYQGNNQQQSIISPIKRDWNDFVSKSKVVINLVDGKADDETVADAREDMERSQEKFNSTIEGILKHEVGQNQALQSAVDGAQSTSLILIVSGFAAAAIFAITLGNFVARRISAPVSRLRNALDDLVHGKYDTEILKAPADEVGDLVTHFGNVREQLKEKDRMKDEFINLAAHELRTPVLPIILTAEELAEEIDGDRTKDKIERILRNAGRLQKLTKDILDVSKIESNSLKLQKEKTDIKNLVSDIVQDVSLKIQDGQDIKIICESALPAGIHEVLIDRGRISEVLVNLLDNAINFTDKGTISVRLEQETKQSRDFIQIKVTDTGRGIDESIKDRLFQKFVTKSDRAKGTGLGLYLCKGIVEAHGGRIGAENNKDGKGGATFTVELPIA